MTEISSQVRDKDADFTRELYDIWGYEQEVLGGTMPQLAEQSYYNHVIVTRDTSRPYVIKIPKDTTRAAELCHIEFKAHASMAIASYEETPPLRVAESLWVNSNPAYITLEYLPGVTLYEALKTRDEALSQPEQEQIGKQLGVFIAWMATRLPGGRFVSAPETPIKKLVSEALGNIEYIRSLGLHATSGALSYVKEVGQDLQAELTATPIIGHRDLHRGNILVNELTEGSTAVLPSAVIDFGNAGLTHPAYEMQLFAGALGPHALSHAVQSYEAATGETLDADLVRYWSVARALVPLCRNARQGLPTHRLKPVMERVCPEEDWTELL
jgi:Ser/Thr protein kinase RdoA (MazF antagonist)